MFNPFRRSLRPAVVASPAVPAIALVESVSVESLSSGDTFYFQSGPRVVYMAHVSSVDGMTHCKMLNEGIVWHPIAVPTVNRITNTTPVEVVNPVRYDGKEI